jgi:hypothetical protein
MEAQVHACFSRKAEVRQSWRKGTLRMGATTQRG